jgi:hypothetical protein
VRPKTRDSKRREHWEKWKRRGYVSYVGLSVIIFTASYGFVRFAHISCFRLGWLNSPGSFSWEDLFFFAILPGFICAQLDWSDMKRKFDRIPANEDAI